MPLEDAIEILKTMKLAIGLNRTEREAIDVVLDYIIEEDEDE